MVHSRLSATYIRALAAKGVFLRNSAAYETITMSGSTPIIDIRTGATEFDILHDIKSGLRPADGGEKKLPTLLLYDEAGLRLFERITYLDEYYLTNAEIEVITPEWSQTPA
jgi:hypothetical protein